ncbi:MAG: putative capsid protein [Cressdnaviricota sp.]|nr:MAG: putative capsid protein [Cressdnaviricota sp.]
MPRRTQALVPFMQAAGMSANQIIAAETALWAAPPVYYAIKNRKGDTRPGPEPYRPTGVPGKKNLTYNQMAPKGAYRTREWTTTRPTRAPKRGGPKMRLPLYQAVPSYKDGRNDHDIKWVNIRDIKTLTINNSTEYNGSVGLHDLQDAPIFKKFSLLYGKVRVKKIKVEFCDGDWTQQVLTSVSALDADEPNGRDEQLKQSTLAIHNISATRVNKYPCQRTFNLFAANKEFHEWTNTTTSDLNGELGTASTPGSKKAVVKYSFTPQHSGSAQRVELTITYLCEFCNLQDITSMNGITL